MTITIAQHSASDTISGATGTMTQTSNRTAGNLNAILVFWGDTVAANPLNSITDSDGNTYAKLGHFNISSSGTGQWEVWRCLSIVSGSGTNTITFHWSSAPTGPEAWAVEAHTTTGSWSDGPFDHGEGTSGTALSTAGVTLASAPTLGLAACTSGTGSAITAGSGWAILDALGGSDSSEWESFAASGSATATCSQGSGGSWNIVAGYFYTAAAAVVIPSILSGVLPRSTVDLPPTQAVTKGTGNPAVAPGILTNSNNSRLGSSIAQDRAPERLPPSQIIGAGSASVFQSLSPGAGNPARAPNIITNTDNALLGTSGATDGSPWLLPPQQFIDSGGSDPFNNISRGAGNPAHAPNVITNTDNALLGTASADPMAPYLLPPPQLRIAGFGQPAQMTPLSPLYGLAFLSTISLPPTDVVVAGAGQPTQSWSLVRSAPPVSVVDLPAFTALPAGSGNAAQQPNILNNGDNAPLVSSAAFAPLEPDLPPLTELLAGAGSQPQATPLFPLVIAAPDLAPLPPSTALFSGFGSPAQLPNILNNGDNSTFLSSASYAPFVPDAPPRQFSTAGKGNPAQPPGILNNGDNAALVASAAFVFFADIPPTQSMLAGFGKAPGKNILNVVGPVPVVTTAELAPTQYVIKGAGNAAQQPNILNNGDNAPLVSSASAAFVADRPFAQLLVTGAGTPQLAPPPIFIVAPAPFFDRPIAQLFIAGAGAAAQPPNIITDSDNSPFLVGAASIWSVPDLPPLAALIAGAGATAEPPFTNYSNPQPYALLAPSQQMAAGAGTPAQSPSTIYGLIAPIAPTLPPSQAKVVGAGFAAVAPFTVSDVPQPPVALPPQDSVIKGAGAPAQPPVTSYGLPAPFFDRPAPQNVFAGFGKSATVGTIGYGLPPRDVPLLPPSAAIAAGFGRPAVSAFVVFNVPIPQAADLPPHQALGLGAGNAAQPWAVFSGLPAPSTDLPPRSLLFAGVGGPSQPAITVVAIPAPFASLPPQDSIFAGFGVPAQGPALFYSLPAPYAILPPQDALIQGAGAPAQSPATFYGLARPSTVDLPTLTTTVAGANKPPPVTVTDALPPPLAPDLPPTQARFAGAGKPAQAPYTLYGLPPVVAASPDLPPHQALGMGAGKPTQATTLLPFMSLPQDVAPLPPAQRMFAGAGQPAQAPFFFVGVPPPILAELPPRQSVFYSLVFLDTLHFVTLPPTRMLVPTLAPSKLNS